MPHPKDVVDAARVAAEAVSGPGSPESVKVVQRVDRLGVWMKGLSGPAVCALLIAFALLVADWVPFLGRLGIWTALTEEMRAQGVVVALIILAGCVGLVVWVTHAGRPSRTEIKAGPVGVTIEQDDDQGDPKPNSGSQGDERHSDSHPGRYDDRRDRFNRDYGDPRAHR